MARQLCLDEHRKGTQPLLQPSRQTALGLLDLNELGQMPEPARGGGGGGGGRSGPTDGAGRLPPVEAHAQPLHTVTSDIQHYKLPLPGLTSSSLPPHDVLCLLYWQRKGRPLRVGIRCPAGRARAQGAPTRVASVLAGSGMMHSGLKLGGRNHLGAQGVLRPYLCLMRAALDGAASTRHSMVAEIQHQDSASAYQHGLLSCLNLQPVCWL